MGVSAGMAFWEKKKGQYQNFWGGVFQAGKRRLPGSRREEARLWNDSERIEKSFSSKQRHLNITHRAALLVQHVKGPERIEGIPCRSVLGAGIKDELSFAQLLSPFQQTGNLGAGLIRRTRTIGWRLGWERTIRRLRLRWRRTVLRRHRQAAIAGLLHGRTQRHFGPRNRRRSRRRRCWRQRPILRFCRRRGEGQRPRRRRRRGRRR